MCYVILLALTGDAGGCDRGGGKQAAASRGVLVLFCTTSSKVHPSEVISVLYPVAGGHSSAAEGGGSDLEGRAWKKLNVMSDEHCFFILYFPLSC